MIDAVFLIEIARLDLDAVALQPAREGQELPHDVGPAHGIPRDGIENVPGLGIGRLLPEDLDRHHDRREDVVQIVRDAAGQRPDAFHPLRAHELRLDSLLLRDVGIDRENRFGTPFAVADERTADLDDEFAPGLGEMVKLAVPFSLRDRQGVDDVESFFGKYGGRR